MRRPSRNQSIFPRWQLGLLVAVCAGAIWYLLPSDPKLIDDLMRDGAYAEARRELAQISPADRSKNPAYFRQLEVRLSKLELQPGDRVGLDAFWREAVTAWRETNYSGPIFLEFTPVIPQLADPASAWAVLTPAWAEAPETQRARLVSDFTRTALAANQPGLAAEIFAAGHPVPRRPDDAAELARLWQLAGRTADALVALDDDASPALLGQRVGLLRALNRNREAFALLRESVEASGGTPDAALAAEITTVGLAAGLASEAAVLVERYVDRNPTDLEAVRHLRNLHLTASEISSAVPLALRAVQLSERATDDLREFARILEFAGQPAAAFNAWLELALRRDVPAVESPNWGKTPKKNNP